jgi:hypothetical protein
MTMTTMMMMMMMMMMTEMVWWWYDDSFDSGGWVMVVDVVWPICRNGAGHRLDPGGDLHQRPDRHQQSFFHIFLFKQNASEGGKQGGIKRGADEIGKAEDDSEGGPRKKQYINTSNSVRESQGCEYVLRRREL